MNLPLEYALVWEQDAPVQFRALTAEAAEFFREHPIFVVLMRSIWVAYREETKDACTIVAVARDLEKALRIVTKRGGISVKPTTPLIREVCRTTDPATGDVTCRMEGSLVDLRG